MSDIFSILQFENKQKRSQKLSGRQDPRRRCLSGLSLILAQPFFVTHWLTIGCWNFIDVTLADDDVYFKVPKIGKSSQISRQVSRVSKIFLGCVPLQKLSKIFESLSLCLGLENSRFLFRVSVSDNLVSLEKKVWISVFVKFGLGWI